MKSLSKYFRKRSKHFILLSLFVFILFAMPASENFIEGYKEDKNHYSENEGTGDVTGLKKNFSQGNRDNNHVLYKGDSFYLLSSFGMIYPAGAYGKFYSPGFRIGLTAGVPSWQIWKFTPEAHLCYSEISGRAEKGEPVSSITLVQFTAGLLYQREFELPAIIRRSFGFLKPDFIFRGRVYDGVSLFSFTLKDQHIETTELIHTFGFSFGLTICFRQFLEVGIEAGYEVVFTKSDPLQAVVFGVVAGGRF